MNYPVLHIYVGQLRAQLEQQRRHAERRVLFVFSPHASLQQVDGMALHLEDFSPTSDKENSSSESDSSSGPRCIYVNSWSSDTEWEDETCSPSKKTKIEHCTQEDPHEQLHRALKKHDCNTIRKLLEDGVKPCTTNRSTNCFILAQKYCDILKKLLEIDPAGVNCQDPRGLTLLMLCCHDLIIFEFLCMYKPDVNILNDDGENALLHILQTHNLYYPWQLQELLELRADLNSVNSKGETALVVAIKQCCNPIVLEALFEAGATFPDNDDENIISRAIQDERLRMLDKIEFLEVLMKYGVDVSAKDSDGKNVMYYIIQEHFKTLRESDFIQTNIYWISELEEILIMLLQNNCEVQGLDETFKRRIYVEQFRYFREKLDIVSTFARYGQSVKFLKQLVDRGLYNWKMPRESFNGTMEPMSPLTAYLSHVSLGRELPPFAEILDMCKYFISIGVDPTHRSRGQNFRFEVSKEWTRRHGTEILQVTSDLMHPDALFFLAITGDFDESWLKDNPEEIADFEELLRLLLRFWPHPPLFLALIGAEMEEKGNNVRFLTYPNSPTFFNLLIKIGGAVPSGSAHFCIKSILEKVAKCAGDDGKATLDSFLKLDGGIPTLRSLSRTAFRATVKKTCSTGLDFSEYRVLCQGEMVPIPEEIIGYLEFRD